MASLLFLLALAIWGSRHYSGLDKLFSLAFFAVLPLPIVAGISALQRLHEILVRSRLTFYPDENKVSGDWLIAWGLVKLRHYTPWPAIETAAEVHLHTAGEDGGIVERLAVAFSDGRRRVIYDRRYTETVHKLCWPDLLALANGVARTLGCPIRLLRTSKPPSAEEVSLAFSNRRLGRREGIALLEMERPVSRCEKAKVTEAPSNVELSTACRVCGDELGAYAVTCERCQTKFHRGCWERAGSCPIPGCGGVVSISSGVMQMDVEGHVTTDAWPFVDVFAPTLWLALLVSAGLLIRGEFIMCWLIVGLFTIVYAVLRFIAPWRGPVREQFTFDSVKRCVNHVTRFLGFRLWWTQGSIDVDDVVEVQQAWYPCLGYVIEEIRLALKDGSSVTIFSQSSVAENYPEVLLTGEEVTNLADKVARCLDRTVRFVRRDVERVAEPAVDRPVQLKASQGDGTD